MSDALKLSDVLSKFELRNLSRLSDVRAAFDLLVHFAIMALAFAIVVVWPNPVTVLISVVMLGGRLQASGVIMHDCAHNAFFRTPLLNRFVGQWLAGAAINAPLDAYRDYHLKHHRCAGTPDDPDLWMVDNYPVDKASLRRKIVRDLTGQTAVRDIMREMAEFDPAQNMPAIVFNLTLIALLTLAGAPWAYLLWWAARIFVYPFIFRLRQISEHGVAENRASPDARENTSTTLASWWEQLIIGPAHVTYHVEHHLFAAVPPYNLGKLHRILKARGYYENHQCLAPSYLDVLRRAVRRDDDVSPSVP